MLGPFSIDTYLPAFAGIASSLDASAVQLQQTLSAYLLGFAVMGLFHGALADSFGRKPVVLVGVALFTLASIGCALAPNIATLIAFRALQGVSAGAGIVISRAVIRDLFAPSEAQRMMSQVTLFFGVAPAVAPLVGGVLFVVADWHAIFWFLALVGVALFVAVWRLLPETLHVSQRQSFHPRPLLAGYRQMLASPRFMALALASAVPFNGMFLYVLSAPVFLGEHLGLSATQFWWFFTLTIAGIMGGAWVSGRAAGRFSPARQIAAGFIVMSVTSVVNVGLNAAFAPHPAWAMLPIALYAFGWALMVPVVTLLVLDLVPERRGMASSVQLFVGGSFNAVVAGIIAPLVMHSTLALAGASAAMLGCGFVAWLWVRSRLR